MDYQSEFKNNSRDAQSSGRTDKVMSTQASHSLKLQDRFRLERPSLSYADFHHEITKNADELPAKLSGTRLKSQNKQEEDDELVKYMSNLPSYLQREESVQERALNIGVLNWGRLENWQHHVKQAPRRNSVCSPSSSNTSSIFGSSGNSCSVQSCSPLRQKMHQPKLQSHQEGSSQGVRPFGEKIQNYKIPQTETSNRQQKKLETYKRTDKNNSEAVLDRIMKNDSDVKITAKEGSRSHLEYYEVASCSNGKKALNDNFVKELENTDVVTQVFSEKQTRIVLLLPIDKSKTTSLTRQPCGSGDRTDKKSTEADQRNPTDKFTSMGFHSRKLHANISGSCPSACEVVRNDHAQIQPPNSMGNESSSNADIPLSSVKVFISPSKSRKIKEKSTRLPIDSTFIKSQQELDQKAIGESPSKGKYSSPTRLFIIGMSRISRSLNFKEGPEEKIPSSSSTHVAAKHDKQRNDTSQSSTGDQNATNRSKSSPLRRLLNPLLKPKTADSGRSLDKASKTSDGQLKHSAVQSVNVNQDFIQIEKDEPVTVQALLQVAIKNGLPLFTFAVDKNKGVLAATVKSLSSSIKNDYSCLFTFFTIQEVKKKMWKTHGGKGKGRDYIPNVIAQMKVSDYQSKEHFTIREFVLFGVELRQQDQQTSDIQPSDELAAIIVKIPNEITTGVTQDRHESNNYWKSYSKKERHYQNFVGSVDHRPIKIILPSGVHSLSSKGEPSSLIERWISGGVCDCGGWDLGCKLRVLDDGSHLDNSLSPSTKCSTTDQFELFDQEGDQENQSVFSLAPFRDGIYSVAFNSSLSHLQAFSICISALESRKLSGISYSNTFSGEKTSNETTSMENHGVKTLNGINTEVYMKCASYPPPLSPVGRV